MSSRRAGDFGVALLVGLSVASCREDTTARRCPPWGRPGPQAAFDRVLGLPTGIIDSKTGIELILIRPGAFLMGHVSGADAWEDSLPVHLVEITKPF
jgi:hypothetical protein